MGQNKGPARSGDGGGREAEERKQGGRGVCCPKG